MARYVLLLLAFCLVPAPVVLADDEILREMMAKNSADYAPVEEKARPPMNVNEGLHYQSKPEGTHADDGNPFPTPSTTISIYSNNYGDAGSRGLPSR